MDQRGNPWNQYPDHTGQHGVDNSQGRPMMPPMGMGGMPPNMMPMDMGMNNPYMHMGGMVPQGYGQHPYAMGMPQPMYQSQQVYQQVHIWGDGVPPEYVKLYNDRLHALPVPIQRAFMTMEVNMRKEVIMRPDMLQQLARNVLQPMVPMGPVQATPRAIDGDEEVVALPRLESSDEAKFTDSEEEDDGNFEKFEPDEVPDELPRRVVESRSNRRQVKRNMDEMYGVEEEEESVESEGDMAISHFVERLDHIYMSRITENGLEYLVRFQEAPPSMCQWVPDSVIQVLPNGKSHLSRFGGETISENSDSLYPIAHRRDSATARPELLFRLLSDLTVLFYWDFGDEETVNKYFESRRRVDVVTDHRIPDSSDVLEEPTASLIKVKDVGSEMRDYQVQGVKWMLDCWRQQHGSILADEMGLGKTIQLLAFLVYLNRYMNWHGPFLIAVRANTFKQWCDEIERWTDLSYVAYQSTPSARTIMREWQFPVLDGQGRPIPGTFSFNVLLVTYDVFLKDFDVLQDIDWQVLVLDEGHRIKNGAGKKNNVFRKVHARHRIILTGTPIQNTLEELWALLEFVSPDDFQESPDFISTELEELTDETVVETRNMIHPHLLRRSLGDVEHSIAPKEERVIFVGLTDIQLELIRLIKLHKVWRLKGVRQTEEESESVNEQHLLFKVCSHPFLLPEAEVYYTEKLGIEDRAELILRCSTKFQWLDNILRVLHQGGHRVLIFSQRVELLKLLDEFVGLRGYTKEMLIGSMTEQEKVSAIERYRNSEAFIFLISTRAGSEGLNLTAADTAILFDPDWNPQNDIQAQARCHRIGQTHKVSVLRLSTFQTYEHEIFVRAQRKLGLWLTLLGSKDVADLRKPIPEGIVIQPPPVPIEPISNPSVSLDEVLETNSTVVCDFSLEMLPVLEKALHAQHDVNHAVGDEEFIESFPVVVEGRGRRMPRSRSRDVAINAPAAQNMYKAMELHGFGAWDEIAESMDLYSTDQIRRLLLMITVVSFRALKPALVPYLPVLTEKLMQAITDEEVFMKQEDLICTSRTSWAAPFGEDFELSGEVDTCRKIRGLITEDPFAYLSVIEMRLIGSCWGKFNTVDAFKWENVAPPFSDGDRDILKAIMENLEFDPFSSRVQAVVSQMRTDIITAQLTDVCVYGYMTPYWTDVEFDDILSVLRNFPVDVEQGHELHAKTTLLGKRGDDINILTRTLLELLEDRRSGRNISLPEDVTHVDLIPVSIARPTMISWTQISIRTCEAISARMEFVALIRHKIISLGSQTETTGWSDYHAQRFMRLLMKFGIDSMRNILIDTRFGFLPMLSADDIEYLKGEKKRRNVQLSGLPDYIFNEEDLIEYVGGDIASMSAALAAKPKPEKKVVKRTEFEFEADPPFEQPRVRKNVQRFGSDSDEFSDDEMEASQSDVDEFDV